LWCEGRDGWALWHLKLSPLFLGAVLAAAGGIDLVLYRKLSD